MTPHTSGLTPPTYKNKQYYKSGTNDKTHDSQTDEYGFSRSDDATLARNLYVKNKNAEDDEYTDHLSIKNDRIDSQSHGKIRKRLFFEKVVIDFVLSNIDQYEKDILAVDYMNKIIETKDKWNQINVLNIQSMLVANCHMPLLHMSKSYIWIEEINQRINEFSFGYMRNPNLFKNRAFKEQVKVCFKKKLVQIPLLILIKYY